MLILATVLAVIFLLVMIFRDAIRGKTALGPITANRRDNLGRFVAILAFYLGGAIVIISLASWLIKSEENCAVGDPECAEITDREMA